MEPNILDNVQKRKGTHGALEGCLYEIQTIFLFMIRACLNNVKFKLVNNADEFGNFDDLVATCELKDGTELLICLQSKHLKESENKIDLNRLAGKVKKYIKGKEKYTDDKRFDLQKYREEILKSKISNYKDLNVKFIFYTTLAISETDTDLQWCNIDNINILCLLLNTSAGSNCVRRFSDTGNEKILSEIEYDKIFLNKICIFSNQCHESNFDKIIKNETKKLLGTKNEDIINKIYTQCIDKLLEWYKNMNLIPFNNDKFLDMVWSFLSKEMPCLSDDGNNYEMLSINYKDNNMASLRRDILENQIVAVKTVEHSTVLPAIEVYKAVSDITSECVRKPVFVKLQKLGKVLKLFEYVIDYLIIELDTNCVDNCALEMLFKILVKKDWKKVVFLASNSIKLDIPLLQNVKIGEHEYKFNFASLSIDTQNYILSCNIKFQGHEMPLSELIDIRDACCVLDYETVEKLFRRETVHIGEELKKLPEEIEHCYIPRSFHCTNVVSSEIFDMTSDSDVLLVSVTNTDLLNKYNRDFIPFENVDENNSNSFLFYHISNPENGDEKDFKHFAAKLQGKNVHWLQERENTLVWLETTGTIKNIQQYVQTCTIYNGMITQQGVSEDILLANDNKLNVLSDDAGKGKTTTLHKIAEQLKLKNKSCWVLHFDLNSTQMIKILFYMSKNKQFEEMDVKKLVKKYFLTKCSQLEISVFNMLLEKSKIYFCFDGLDEISPRYENIFIAIVKKLNQNSAKQIWFTSREHMEKLLHDNFPVFPIKLLDISVEDRVNFCVKYYTFKLKNGNKKEKAMEKSKEQKIKHFFEALIKNLSSVNDTILEFMGIPLLTKMLASINVEQCRKYLNNTHEEANLPMTFDNIFDLYQSFFENAIKRYLTEKIKMDLKHPILSLENKIKKYQTLHMFIATRSLLPEHYSKLITDQGEQDKLTSDQKTKLLGIGIITSLEKHNVKFLHFTFAELMLANSLLVNLNQIQELSVLQNILDEILHNKRWKVVRNFLNSSTLLAKNISNIKYNPTTMHTPDEEETSLIIALEEGNRNIAKYILQCLRGVNEADAETWINRTKRSIFRSLSALHIAIGKGYKEEVSLLLDLGANIEEDLLNCDTPLSYAVTKGNLEITSFLLARGANIHQRGRVNRTAILVAACSSTPEVLDLLLTNGASLEAKGDNDESLLMYAADNKRNDMLVHVLGKVEWDVNYKGSLGRTALHEAAFGAKCLNIKTLLDHGADINSQNNDGETPLHIVLQYFWFVGRTAQRQLCAKYLIKRGARTDITDNAGKTAWESSDLNIFELNDLREWIEKHSEHVSIVDLEQQLENNYDSE